VHCSFEVSEYHVEQAVSLLNNSIIKIDQSDYTVTIDDAMIEEAGYAHQQQQ
jgi:DNA replicative helicase MCM subunit Mcm2 (Cdc46/Mcm family)